MRQLVQALENTTGKKQYGYLKKPLKLLVDAIVDELAKVPEVAECYEVWNQIREELNECYGNSTPWERLPLSQRKEFRKIKNDIIREAENIRLGLPTFEDEKMRDEPEPEEHHAYSMYEQAQRYRAAKSVLQDIDALDEEHAEAVKELEQLWSEGYTVAAHQLGSAIGMTFPQCAITKKRNCGSGYLQRPEMISLNTHWANCFSRKCVQRKRYIGWARPLTTAISSPGTALERSISPASPCQRMYKKRWSI